MFSFHAEIHKLFIWNPESPNLPPPNPFTLATSPFPCQVPGESTEHWGPARQAILLIVGSSADQRSLPQDTRLDSGRLKRLARWSLPLGSIPVPTGASTSRGAVEHGTHPMNTECIPSIDREPRILDHTPLPLWSPPEVRVCCYWQLCGHACSCCVIFTHTTKMKSVAKDVVQKSLLWSKRKKYCWN